MISPFDSRMRLSSDLLPTRSSEVVKQSNDLLCFAGNAVSPGLSRFENEAMRSHAIVTLLDPNV